MESFLAWLIESSLLIWMIFGIRKIFSGRISHAGIYALWLVVLIRFIVPVNFISTPVSVANLIEGRFAMYSEEEVDFAARDAQAGPEEKGQYDTDGIIGVLGSMPDGGTVRDRGQDAEGEGEGTKVLAQQKQEPVRGDKSPGTPGGSFSHWVPVFAGMRTVISVLLFAWLFFSNVRLLGKLKENRLLYGKKKNLKIYSTNAVKNPCLYGFFRPAVYLPEHLIPKGNQDAAREEELEQIILHEYVHYRHGDHIWGIFRMLLISVYWFSPFVWMAASASKKDAELFCDETVIRLLGEEKRFRYGDMLVRLAGDRSFADFRYAIMPVSRTGKEMMRRIRAISVRKCYSRWVLLPLTLVLMAAIGITGSTGFGPLAKERSQSEEEESGAAQTAGEADRAAAGGLVQEQLMVYRRFLKKHAGEKEFRYYSLVWMAEDHVVLLGTDRIKELAENSHGEEGFDPSFGSDCGRIYDISDGKVVDLGEVSCTGPNWIHFSDHKLLTNTSYAVMGTRLEGDSGKLKSEPEAAAGEPVEQDSVLFFMNPYTKPESGTKEPIALALQNEKRVYTLGNESGRLLRNHAETPEEAFENYMKTFIYSVNSGDTSGLRRVLAEGSQVYGQQSALVENYYKRGIREELKSYSITSMEELGRETVEVSSRESMNVSYADGTSKLIRQKYCYTCIYQDEEWIISDMKAI